MLTLSSSSSEKRATFPGINVNPDQNLTIFSMCIKLNIISFQILFTVLLIN